MKAVKLPSGSWRVQVQKDGKRYNFTSKDKETAKENARTFLKVKADVTAMPLGDAIDEYIALKRNILSPSTIKGYEQIRQAYLPELMKIPIQDLNSIVMQRAINVISANHSPKTVRNIYGLRSVEWYTTYQLLKKLLRWSQRASQRNCGRLSCLQHSADYGEAR